MDNLIETVEVGVKSVSMTVPVRVTMTSYDNTPFEFTASIDEVGQIILTPISKNVEFVEANTTNNVETEVPIEQQETVVEKDGNMITKKTTIFVQAVMLSESEDESGNGVSADIDEIGQCVIYPSDRNNVFISVTFSDSLNLITEDMRVVNYFGYTLTNTGDGWDIRDYLNNEIETGVATEAEAKIIVLQTELEHLESLTEEVTDSSKLQDDPIEVEATVLDEGVEDSNSEQIKQTLEHITHNFTDTSGGVSCDTGSEKDICLNIIQQHYLQVNVDTDGSKTLIYYAEPVQDATPSDESERIVADNTMSTDGDTSDDNA